jgi:outer membrane protein assembly factor BamB
MPRDLPILIFVGIKNHLLALDATTGAEVWRTELKGSDFVSVLWDGQHLTAANAGEAFGIDPLTGSVLWHNPLKGLGLGVVSLASSRMAGAGGGSDEIAARKRQHAQAAAASAGA